MKKRIMTRKTKQTIFIICMLAFPIAHFCVFWVWKNYSSIMLAFRNQYTDELGFDNFQKFFKQFASDWSQGRGVKIAIENTLLTVAQRMFVSTPLVVFTAYVLFKKYYGHMFFRVVFYIPGIIGTVIMATMLGYVLDTVGPIVKAGSALGIKWSFDILQTGLLGNTGSARITYFVTAMLGISGSTVLLLTGALQRIPQDLFDSMKIDGVGMFREFTHFVVPFCWPTIGVMWIMTFAGVWGDYSRVMMLTNGNYNTNNFAYYLFGNTIQAINGTVSYNYVAAMGLLLTAFVAPATLFLRWVSSKLVEPIEF